jgi:catechol 2,3-dioxygenase-like lactoylglutathione lyase family enzyme
MRYLDRYPVVVTDAAFACRDFWVKHLGFTVIFENEWFVYMQAAEASASVAFATTDHPSSPPGHVPFSDGMSMELEVADANVALAEVRATGKEPDYPLTNEPFGQRRVGLLDPAGVWVNVAQQTALPE